ncbi:hypothetical protein MUG78_17755 [Gordonia alkaliphila]|uniref:hypothetical protein n=1 Tax=Gordonia alkaliphila TaxID=1053547 RepID=UPI001FF567C7|nr:hypothetical protein [Gordonia alkaliphila]MCK0441247.1 hypothetical protein [Gordonia alkaliphila]
MAEMIHYDPFDTDVRGWFEIAENQEKVAAKIAAEARSVSDSGPYSVDLTEHAIIAIFRSLGPACPRTGGEIEIVRKAFHDHYGQNSQYRIVTG